MTGQQALFAKTPITVNIALLLLLLLLLEMAAEAAPAARELIQESKAEYVALLGESSEAAVMRLPSGARMYAASALAQPR